MSSDHTAPASQAMIDLVKAIQSERPGNEIAADQALRIAKARIYREIAEAHLDAAEQDDPDSDYAAIAEEHLTTAEIIVDDEESAAGLR